MACCDNCRFVRGRQPEASIPQGWCHRGPPQVFKVANEPLNSSQRPVSLMSWCGEHRWSLAGFFRLFKR